MESKDILKFCLDKGLLVDNEVLNLFSGASDTESIKLIIDKIKTILGKGLSLKMFLLKIKSR